MSYTIGSVKIRIGGDIKDLERDLKRAGSVLKREGKNLQELGNTLTTYVTLPIAAAGAASIKFASDFNESLNKVKVSFKDSSGEVEQFAKTTLNSFGIAEGSALDMAALFGDMATSMGLSTSEASKMSTSLVGLAGDLSSFKNIGISEVQTALAGIFTGETESLKRLGVVMTQANVEAYALSKGLKVKFDQLSQNEKVLLRYNYVLDATKNAQGDFSRTSDGAANQQRIFKETLKETAATFGQEILPVYTAALQRVNELIKGFAAMDQNQKQNIVTVAGLAAATGPAVSLYGSLKGLFGTFLKDILPNLVTRFGSLTNVVKGAGVAGVVAYGLLSNWDKLEALFKKVYEALEPLAPLISLIGDLFRTAGAIISLVIGSIIDLISAAGTSMAAFNKLVYNALNPFDGTSPEEAWKEFYSTISSEAVTASKNIKDNLLRAVTDIYGESGSKRPAINRGGAFNRNRGGGSSSATGLNIAGVGAVTGNNEDGPGRGLIEVAKIGNDRKAEQIELSNAVAQGLDIENKLLESQKGRIQELDAAMALHAANTKVSMEGVKSVYLETSNTFSQISADFSEQIRSLASGAIAELGVSLANIFTGDANAGTFFSRLIGLIADFGVTVGKQMIELGIAGLALKKLFSNPFTAIAAGTLLIGISTALKSLSKSSIPSLAIGTDLVQRDGLAQLHKGEAVVPASVVRGGFKGGGMVRVVGSISGNVIALSGESAKRFGTYNRFR